MSPEQVLATGKIGAPSDIYSTGVVLYEIVTGRPPFRGDTPFEVMLGHQSAGPVPPSRIDPAIPPALDRVILTALHKDPERRFRTATEFQIALQQAAVSAVPGNHRRALPLVAAAVLTVACAVAFWFVPLHRTAATVAARPQPAAARLDASAAPAPVPASLAAVLSAESAAEPTAAIAERVRAETPKLRHPKKPAPHHAEALSHLPRFATSPADVGPEPALPQFESKEMAPEAALPAAVAVKPHEAAQAQATDPPTAPTKRRNPIVRTLGRIFHGKKPPQKQP